MPALLPRLFLVGLLGLTSSLVAQDKNFYVFLCLGQSNMEGFPGIKDEDKGPVDQRFQMLAAVDFPLLERTMGHWYPAVPPLCRPSTGLGPTDYFGRTLVAQLPAAIKVGVVNVAVAGAKIEVFDKEHFGDYAATAPAWMKGIIAAYGGNPYARLVELGREARKAGVIKGILLHQGESNPNDPAWAAKVKAVYENLLHDLDLQAADVPLIAGEVVNADQQGKCAAMNQTIDALPRTIPTAHIVSSAGCACRADHLHFTPEGYRELGRRYAATVLPLLGVKAEPGH
ncbi:MAG TPA: sialate O-acetylesterase [Lacunisphaera sp.]|nr:sialate O-acetylesterase [Lacunisphaera sp.]